jgi:cell division protease FtsH
MNDDKQPEGNTNWVRTAGLWLAIIAVLAVFAIVFDQKAGLSTSAKSKAIGYSEFLTLVNDHKIKSAEIGEDYITAEDASGKKINTLSPNDPRLVDRLIAANVKFSKKPEGQANLALLILMQYGPFLLFFAFGYYVFRQMQKNAGGGAMGFGKSRAKMLTEKQGRVTFDDVAGIDEAREELEEIVDFLKDPAKFSRLGGKIPKGALLVGSPGTGKTLLARAIAGEAKVPFFTISGSDFVEMFVGVGASRVRDMFEQAKKSAPCIVFIDEIDAVGRHRGAGLGNGNDEREQTLNQLLVEMDGFEANEGIIIIAATNRPDVLDPALLRPGRFDRQVVVPRPDIEGREKILAVHMKKIPLAPDVDARTIARGTPGFSGADLANLVNEAALLAARMGKRLVAMAQFESAKDKVMMGSERKSMVMTDDEKKMTAYHEAGHAIVALYEPASDPIHKATIIPRGRALGMVMRLPERDNYSYHRDKMFANLSVSMGGRVAEEVIFGYDKVSSGASSDISYATSLARDMVTRWGMSDTLGPLEYAEADGETFLGYSSARPMRMSNETAQLIDAEIKRIVEGALDRAKTLLKKHLKDLHTLAEALLEYETLSGDEIKGVLKGEKPDRSGIDHNKPAALATGGSSIPKTRRKPVIGGIATQGA